MDVLLFVGAGWSTQVDRERIASLSQVVSRVLQDCPDTTTIPLDCTQCSVDAFVRLGEEDLQPPQFLQLLQTARYLEASEDWHTGLAAALLQQPELSEPGELLLHDATEHPIDHADAVCNLFKRAVGEMESRLPQVDQARAGVMHRSIRAFLRSDGLNWVPYEDDNGDTDVGSVASMLMVAHKAGAEELSEVLSGERMDSPIYRGAWASVQRMFTMLHDGQVHDGEVYGGQVYDGEGVRKYAAALFHAMGAELDSDGTKESDDALQALLEAGELQLVVSSLLKHGSVTVLEETPGLFVTRLSGVCENLWSLQMDVSADEEEALAAFAKVALAWHTERPSDTLWDLVMWASLADMCEPHLATLFTGVARLAWVGRGPKVKLLRRLYLYMARTLVLDEATYDTIIREVKALATPGFCASADALVSLACDARSKLMDW